LGLGTDVAARAALREFGDPWKVRTDLGRVHRGRTVIVFPRTLAERLRALAIYDLVPLAVVLALLLLVRWQVVQAYNIPTKSMEPTLHGEEDDPDYILVDKTAFLRRDPHRWDIVVFYPPLDAERRRPGEDRSAFVKRCVALGGETVDILGGDLYIDTKLARRPPEIEDAMMVPLYDLGIDLKDAARRARLSPVSGMIFGCSWDEGKTGNWSLQGGRLAADPGTGGEARLAYLRPLGNTYTEPNGLREDSDSRVSTRAGDLEVRFLAEGGSPETVVGADLTEGTGDAEERHRLRVGPAGITITSGGRTWTNSLARFGPGRPMEVRFRNVDCRLTAWVDGEVVLRVELTPRTFPPLKDPAPGGVELVAEGGPASFGGVRILRDVVYLRLGSDSSWPRRVPEESYFMLGDNTGNSLDSRVWGSVEAKDLIGLPFAVVYPPTRAKLLR
jgi:signal peptidase I